jgi:hypothetical protein
MQSPSPSFTGPSLVGCGAGGWLADTEGLKHLCGEVATAERLTRLDARFAWTFLR